MASDTTQLQVQEPEPEPEPEPEAPGEQGDTSDETPAAPLSAAAAAVAAAAALAAKHVEGSDVELAKVWVEIAGGAGTLTASELRTVFQKLGREMSDDVSSRSAQPPSHPTSTVPSTLPRKARSGSLRSLVVYTCSSIATEPRGSCHVHLIPDCPQLLHTHTYVLCVCH